MARRRQFGSVEKLPSGRYRARHRNRDGSWTSAQTTFTTKAAAQAWLAREQVRIEQEIAGAPTVSPRPTITLQEYGAAWLARADLRPTTRRKYSQLWPAIDAGLGKHRLAEITPQQVSDWYHTVYEGHPSSRAHAYGLLRTMLNAAVAESVIENNPCRIRGAAGRTREREIIVISPAQIADLEAGMPARLAAMVTLAAWCGLRFGEIAELRRGDVDLTAGTVSVTRSVTRGTDGMVVGPTKTRSGRRVVAIPPHVLSRIRAHLEQHVASTDPALLFPRTPRGTAHLDHGSSFIRPWTQARAVAGLPHLRFHDLRHTALTMAAQAGATTAELARRAGHSSLASVAIYQHAAAERDRALAARLSELAATSR